MKYLEVISENITDNSTEAVIKKYLPWVCKELGIKQAPEIKFLDQPMTTSFGTYSPEDKCIYLVVGSRHVVDVMRTLAHELTHYRQDINGELEPGAGETGTPQENEANSEAGVVMRNFNQKNPEHLKQ